MTKGLRNVKMMLVSTFKIKVKQLLEESGYRVSKPGPYSIFDFESFLLRHIEVHENLTYVQIGANDGILNDPMYKFVLKNSRRVTGYLLEPVPEIYEKLKLNYSAFSNFKFFNLAIHEVNLTMKLYKVKKEHESKLPKFSKGIASFDPKHWKKLL
jgi:hypothetical protein